MFLDTDSPMPTMLPDNNISVSPCGCLPPPPDFDLRPPPWIPGLSINSDMLSIFSDSDSLFRICPEGSVYGPKDNLTPPAWLDIDASMSVTKSKSDGALQQRSVATILGAITGATTLLVFFAALLGVYYCGRHVRERAKCQHCTKHISTHFRKRSPPCGPFFCCFHSKKEHSSSSLNRQRADIITTTSFTDYCRDDSSAYLDRCTNGDETDREIEIEKPQHEKDYQRADEIPVGANWTFRRIKKKGNDLNTVPLSTAQYLPQDSGIYDIPQALPKPPSIVVPVPGILRPSHSFGCQLSSYNNYSQSTAPQFETSFAAFDNHNPVYEEISLCSNSQSVAESLKYSNSSQRLQIPRTDQCGDDTSRMHGFAYEHSLGSRCNLVSSSNIHCKQLGDGGNQNNCSGSDHHAAGYARAVGKNRYRLDRIAMDATDQRKLKSHHARMQRQHFQNERKADEGRSRTAKATRYGIKSGTAMSPKRSSGYYANGSLAVSFADGFHVCGHNSAFV